MPFRARLNPASLARRREACLRYAVRPVVVPARPAVSATFGCSVAGPGPSSYSSLLLHSRLHSTTATRHSAFTDFFSRASSKKNQSASRATLAPVGPETETIAVKYEDIVNEIESSPRLGGLSSEEILRIMETISARDSDLALDLIKRIYYDMEPVHAVQVTEDHTRAMIMALATHGDTRGALELAESLVRDGGYVTHQEWTAIFRSAATAHGTMTPYDIVASIRDMGAAVDERLYAPIIQSLLLREYVSHKDLQEVLDRMNADGVQPGLWCEAQMVAVALKMGDVAKAKAIIDAWSPNDIDDDELRRELWGVLVVVEIARDDATAVEAALRFMGGSMVPPSALVYLIQRRLGNDGTDARKLLDAAVEVDRASGCQIPAATWGRLITHFLGNGGSVKDALMVYREARGSSTIITTNLANTLISRLCKLKPPRLTEAMEVYGDLLSAAAADPLDTTLQPSKRIYIALLEACVTATEPASATVLALLGEMSNRHIKLGPKKAFELCIDLMRRADDHPGAYDIYKSMQGVTAEELSFNQFRNLVTSFINLSYLGSSVPPPEYVVNMMKDMRRAGHYPDSRILSTLLKSYATLCKRARKAAAQNPAKESESEFQIAALLAATRDIHALVNLDSLIDITVPLLSTLMDAFSSAGAYDEALDVWDEIVRLRPTIPASEVEATFSAPLSVVIDTCGFAGLPVRAKRIWTWARRHDLVDERNWTAWIECLARLGKFDEALDVLEHDMGKNGAPEARPEYVAIVLKLAFLQPTEMQRIHRRVKDTWPQWWDGLKELFMINQQNRRLFED